MEKKRVAIYVRVSSEEQAKEGLSLNAQKRRLEEYALSKDWYVYKIYEDAGVSAKIPIKKRPQGKEMFLDAQKNKFSAILLFKLDRAFRSTIDAILTSDELKEKKIDLISLSEQIDTTSAMGKFFFTLMSALAQLERELTSDRLNLTLNDKFQQGIMVGKLPIGYKWNKKTRKIQIDPNKSEMIKGVFDMASKGINYKIICEKYKIIPKTYYRIKKNKVYMGIIEYRGLEKDGTYESLVSKELFDKVNKNV